MSAATATTKPPPRPFSSLANSSFSFLLTIDAFREKFPKEFAKPSFLKITTMTITSKLNVDPTFRLDTQKIKDRLARYGTMRLRRVERTGVGPLEWTLQENNFMNQLTLVHFNGYSTKSVKVFPNGSVQVAGCSDLFDARRVITQLRWLFRRVLRIAIEPDDFTVAMINSNFSLNHTLNLNEVTEHFLSYPRVFSTSFDPDRYSAVKVKWRPFDESREITASVFSSGKIIVTGATTLKQIAHAYHQITDTINARPDLRVSRTEEVELFENFLGYDARELVPFLKARGYRSWIDTTEDRKINL